MTILRRPFRLRAVREHAQPGVTLPERFTAGCWTPWGARRLRAKLRRLGYAVE
jgi:hypothetical protein